MLNNPAVMEELSKISSSTLPPVTWTLTAHLIVDGVQVLTFRNVVFEKYSADFAGSVGPYHFISVQLGAVVYRDFIVPNQNKMKILLRKTVINPVTEETIEEHSRTYLGFLPEPIDINKLAVRNNMGTDNTDEYNLVTFPIQLVEQKLYELMNTETSSVYRGTTYNVVANQLVRELENNQQTDILKAKDFSGLRGIVAERFQNDKEYSNIVIEQGVRLKNLCRYIQTHYGISSFGVNTFFSNGLWYMFPLFKHDRYNSAKRTLTIYNVPPSEMPTMDKTFSLRDKDLFVISTGNTKIKDDSVRTEVNKGNGIRMTPISFYDNNHFDAKGNRVTPGGTKNAREFISKESGHKIYNVAYQKEKFSANPYPAISELASTQGSLLTLSWHNADIEMLCPGMPARIYYENNDELVYVDGTLLGINAVTNTANNQLAEVKYSQSAELTFHIKDN